MFNYCGTYETLNDDESLSGLIYIHCVILKIKSDMIKLRKNSVYVRIKIEHAPFNYRMVIYVRYHFCWIITSPTWRDFLCLS